MAQKDFRSSLGFGPKLNLSIEERNKMLNNWANSKGQIHLTESEVKHCGNCRKSTDTRNMKKPLICNSEGGRKQFGTKAGSGDCAKNCRNFQILTFFGTAGLVKKN